jgi:secreted PhoX family phosphatase
VGIDASGNLFIADTDNHTIRRIAPNGTVVTIAGASGQRGSLDGVGNAARFSNPKGVAVDGNGNIYIADYQNSGLRKITPTGVVTTVTLVTYIQGVAIDQTGNAFLSGQQTHRITKVSAFGNPVVIGGNGSQGNFDGIGGEARFQYPEGVAVDSSGDVFVADTNNNRISKGVPIGPYFEAIPAANVSVTTASLNGTVNPNGYLTTAWFDYGQTTAYGSTVGVTLSPDNGLSVQNVSAQNIRSPASNYIPLPTNRHIQRKHGFVGGHDFYDLGRQPGGRSGAACGHWAS